MRNVGGSAGVDLLEVDVLAPGRTKRLDRMGTFVYKLEHQEGTVHALCQPPERSTPRQKSGPARELELKEAAERPFVAATATPLASALPNDDEAGSSQVAT